jgi:sigma-B regulation protein RsbU (phosphoserine phosphatase)
MAKIRTLIVDDNPADREWYKQILVQDAEHDFVFFEVATGADACAFFADHHLDCVLLDSGLPDQTGLEVLSKWNGAKAAPEAPAIVMLTETGGEAVVRNAFKSGVHDSVVKSELTPKVLQQTVRQALDTVARVRDREQAYKALSRRLEDADEELRVAGEIQRQFLPQEAPSWPAFDVCGRCVPAEATGGDFYDYLALHDGTPGIVLADVSGHGLGPALLAAETRAYLRAFASLTSSPGQLLLRTNQLLCDDTGGVRFVTLFVATLYSTRRLVRFAAAGHRFYVLNAAGAVTAIDSFQPPLGVSKEHISDRERRLTLRPGDVLVALTDGIAEATLGDESLPVAKQMFGFDQALSIIRQHRNRSAEEIVGELFDAVHDFTRRRAQEDDMTVVVVKAV